MMQRINRLQNNRSVFWTVVTFVVPKTELIHLVLVGLTACQQAGRRKPCCFKKILKVIIQLLMRFSEI